MPTDSIVPHAVGVTRILRSSPGGRTAYVKEDGRFDSRWSRSKTLGSAKKVVANAMNNREQTSAVHNRR